MAKKVSKHVIKRIEDKYFKKKLRMATIARSSLVSYSKVKKIISKKKQSNTNQEMGIYNTDEEEKNYNTENRFILSEQHKIMIEEHLQRFAFSSYQDLLVELDLPSCSVPTLSRFCNKNKIKTYFAIKQTGLDGLDKTNRLNFANYLDKELKLKKEDYQKFFFTDECKISNKLKGRLFVKTTDERDDPNFYDKTPKRIFKISIYVYISLDKQEIFRIDGDFNSQKYEDILVNSGLLHNMSTMYTNGYFLQGNSSNHELPIESGETIKSLVQSKGMVYLELAPYSMDLNVIKNVWSILESRMKNKIRREKIVVRNEDHLWKITQLVWSQINKRTFKKFNQFNAI